MDEVRTDVTVGTSINACNPANNDPGLRNLGNPIELKAVEASEGKENLSSPVSSSSSPFISSEGDIPSSSSSSSVNNDDGGRENQEPEPLGKCSPTAATANDNDDNAANKSSNDTNSGNEQAGAVQQQDIFTNPDDDEHLRESQKQNIMMMGRAKDTLKGKAANALLIDTDSPHPHQQQQQPLGQSQQRLKRSPPKGRIYRDRKRKLREEGYLEAFKFVPSPNSKKIIEETSAVAEGNVGNEKTQQWSTTRVQEIKHLTEKVPGITYSQKSPCITYSKYTGAGASSSPLLCSKRSKPLTESICGITYSKHCKVTSSQNPVKGRRSRSRQRPKPRPRRSLDAVIPLYYPPTQFVGNEIDTTPGLAFHGFDDSDSDDSDMGHTRTKISPADRFERRQYVEKWRPRTTRTAGRRNRHAKGRSQPMWGGNKPAETLRQNPDRYKARKSFGGVSVNLGSDHYNSTGAAAALDIANRLYHGHDCNVEYNVLTESEVTKSLKAVGYDHDEIAKERFTRNFGVTKKKQFEDAVDLALSCIGGRDDNLAEILCDIENMSDFDDRKMSAEKDATSKAKKKRIQGVATVSKEVKGDSENDEYSRPGKHLIYLVDKQGRYVYELDKSLKPTVGGKVLSRR